LKISIITVTYNSASTIAETLHSVADQHYPDIEHIVIDGASKDNTLEIVKRFVHVSKVISEPDKGMYDALNKGIRLATGDYVGILNSDDALHNSSTITDLVKEIQKDRKDAYFADIRFIKPKNRAATLRYYSSAHFHPKKFEYGYMPAHPSFYMKRALFEKHGLYETNYTIAADYELLIRYLYTHQVSYRYLPLLMVDMLPGGLSNNSLFSRYLLNREIVMACATHGIKTNIFKLSLKYFKKVFEYFPNKKI
jgi:glycosyltransferase involved in cell wall biosynthesis